VAVESKSNEIVAIPKLLELLDITGCIVTIDAMGCQKEIAKQITANGGNYVFCLKENHPNLYNEVKDFFNSDNTIKDTNIHQTTDCNHGRIEVRKYISASAKGFEHASAWKGIESVGMIESKREINGEVSLEKRYYISSLESNAERFGKAVRTHWQIENSLHWVLDVVFNEDQCRIRDKHAAENFALLRRMAIGLLKNEKSSKKSIRRKKNQASWDDEYLLRVLQANVSVSSTC